MDAGASTIERKAPSAPATQTEESVGLEAFRAIDRMREALTAHATGGISLTSLALAVFDWWLHLAAAPGKRAELVWKAGRKSARLGSYLMALGTDPETPPCIEPLPGDKRFAAEQWRKFPYNVWSQAFLLQQQWWYNATHEVPGVTPHHEDVVSFAARQLLDMVSPSNIPSMNPEIIGRTISTGGTNLAQGFMNWMEDVGRLATGRPPVGAESFVVGQDVAVTPGKVVFRNELIELLQYAPSGDTVLGEPILIVPAWIMKYYILDLSPQNSLVRYMVSQGFTVFCVSWRNPSSNDRDLTLNDYRQMGIMAALDAINAIVPERKVHLAGYCLGGTLSAITAAAMARRGDQRLVSLTLFAAQTDFAEPGELALFIDHSQMHFLESMMWNKGYLSADQMAGAFQLLRSNDLIWSRYIHDYQMGQRTPMTDLMAWNSDSTRMPYKMHAEYLQRLYLDNELAAGRFMVDGRPAAIQNIRVPIFVVATERDHVAPWRSVYKIHYLCDSDLTFVLTSGGHNAGIVSPPNHPERHFRVATMRPTDPCLGPDEWSAAAEYKDGSWWLEWTHWLATHSGQDGAKPPGMGRPEKGYPPGADAPGAYVHQR